MSESLRLFFALWPEPAVQAAIRRRTRAAVRHSGGRPVPVRDLHATLVFLGSQPAARLPAIMDAAASVAPLAGELRLSRLGTFPRARVLWLGPERTPPLLAAGVRRLRRALQEAGIGCEAAPFRAHVTLARKIGAAQPAAVQPLSWRYRGIALVASEPGPRGSRYRTVAQWPAVPLAGA